MCHETYTSQGKLSHFITNITLLLTVGCYLKNAQEILIHGADMESV